MMSKILSLYNSSVGQKFIVGLTGLFLCSFLVVHLSGNMLLFRKDGGQAFEHYSEFMSTNVGIRTMEIVLALGFLVHIIMAVIVWAQNRIARPVRYEVNRPSENSTLSSRVMFVTGSIVFIFLVVHLRTFFVPVRFATGVKPMMFDLVQGAFSNPFYDAFYIVAMILLGYHLKHGFQSAFQTFGIRPHYRRVVDAIAVIFWLVIPAAFATMPLFFLWQSHKGAF
jgi:succinate dehydrogenase / fumarate reductase, cytochrome b subunit